MLGQEPAPAAQSRIRGLKNGWMDGDSNFSAASRLGDYCHNCRAHNNTITPFVSLQNNFIFVNHVWFKYVPQLVWSYCSSSTIKTISAGVNVLRWGAWSGSREHPGTDSRLTLPRSLLVMLKSVESHLFKHFLPRVEQECSGGSQVLWCNDCHLRVAEENFVSLMISWVLTYEPFNPRATWLWSSRSFSEERTRVKTAEEEGLKKGKVCKWRLGFWVYS